MKNKVIDKNEELFVEQRETIQETIDLIHQMVRKVDQKHDLKNEVTNYRLNSEVIRFHRMLVITNIIMLLLAICVLIIRLGG